MAEQSSRRPPRLSAPMNSKAVVAPVPAYGVYNPEDRDCGAVVLPPPVRARQSLRLQRGRRKRSATPSAINRNGPMRWNMPMGMRPKYLATPSKPMTMSAMGTILMMGSEWR